MIWIILILSLPAAFILSGISSALLNVSRVRARHAADEGDHAGARIAKLLEQRNELHHAVTVLHHLCELAAFACCATVLVGWLGSWGWLAAVVVALPVFLVGLQLVPKLLFSRYPFRILRRLTPLLIVIQFLARPWIWLARLVQRGTKSHPFPDESNFSLQSLANTVSTLGVLPEPVCHLVRRTAAFQRLRAADLILPLAQLTALPPDMPLASAVALNAQPQHPWRAVLQPDGRLIGWLDMTAIPPKPSRDKLVRQFMRPLLQVRVYDPALRCLQALRKRGEPIAAVLDAKGETVGVILQQSLTGELLQYPQ